MYRIFFDGLDHNKCDRNCRTEEFHSFFNFIVIIIIIITTVIGGSKLFESCTRKNTNLFKVVSPNVKFYEVK